MDLEIRHLQLVRAVAGAGTLTGAGAVLHLSQSALSHQLRDIESRLGTPLFLRAGKRMLMTPAGERLLRSADAVLDALEQTEIAVKQMAGGGRGLLRISTECYTCYHWLPALIKRYRRAHPRVDVSIEPSATENPVAHLIDGRLDLAIVSDPVRDRRIVTRRLFDDEMVAIMEPNHPLAAKPYVIAGDFATETLLAYSPKEESTFYQRYLVAARVAPARFQQIQLTEAVIELVKAGLGVAVLARWAVAPALAAGMVCGVPLRPAYRRTWSAAALKDIARVPHVREFVALVADHPPFARTAAGEPAGRAARHLARASAGRSGVASTGEMAPPARIRGGRSQRV